MSRGTENLASTAGISLVADSTVQELNQQLSRIYEQTADRYFRHLSESILSERVRAYDNHQRLTFGRAQSRLQLCRNLTSGFDLGLLERIDSDGPDTSGFPGAITDNVYSPLKTVIEQSLYYILRDSHVEQDELAMVTVLLHRVLVRPGETYKGFFHRDLAPRTGRIGTIIWYPEIRYSLIEGLEFIAYSAEQDVPLGVLRSRKPDFAFPPDQYARNALLLTYPNNYPHGVLPGRSVVRSPRQRRPSPADFISPDPDLFFKDLAIITVSERSPVEQ